MLTTQKKHIYKSYVAIVYYTIAAFIFLGCQTKQEITDAITDPKTTPQINADSITTIVSDSGIIRYRVTTTKWAIYDKADTPYWDFPLGLRFERFDKDYNIDAEIQCDKAIFYSEIELWKLNNNIEATNLSGEEFYTNEIFWDQKKEKVYSDSTIKIIQSDKTIYGVGFESNQTFSKYSIRKPTGVIPINE